MRKDIKSINEAYIKSTRGFINESFNEDQDYETEGAKTALDQIKDRLHYLSPGQLKELQSIIANEFDEDYESAVNSSPKKLYFNGKELKEGDLVTDEMGVEEGIIVGIRYPEVYVKEFNTNDYTQGEEGWTVSEENDNMGSLVWR